MQYNVAYFSLMRTYNMTLIIQQNQEHITISTPKNTYYVTLIQILWEHLVWRWFNTTNSTYSLP
jgi:hypothetical protein